MGEVIIDRSLSSLPSLDWLRKCDRIAFWAVARISRDWNKLGGKPDTDIVLSDMQLMLIDRIVCGCGFLSPLLLFMCSPLWLVIGDW